MVQRVIAFRAEFHARALRYWKLLGERNIPYGLAVASHARQEFWKGADVVGPLLLGVGHKPGRRIEPPRDRPLVAGQSDVLDIAEENRVAKSQSLSALVRHDGVQLPVTNDEFERPRDVGR